jgi:hypothetical protein
LHFFFCAKESKIKSERRQSRYTFIYSNLLVAEHVIITKLQVLVRES